MGSIMMPFVLFPLDEMLRESVYVLFFVISLGAAWICYKYIEETMGMVLDSRHKGSVIELKSLTSNEKL